MPDGFIQGDFVPPRKSPFSPEVHKEGSLKANFHSQIFLVSGKLFAHGKCAVKIFSLGIL